MTQLCRVQLRGATVSVETLALVPLTSAGCLPRPPGSCGPSAQATSSSPSPTNHGGCSPLA